MSSPSRGKTSSSWWESKSVCRVRFRASGLSLVFGRPNVRLGILSDNGLGLWPRADGVKSNRSRFAQPVKLIPGRHRHGYGDVFVKVGGAHPTNSGIVSKGCWKWQFLLFGKEGGSARMKPGDLTNRFVLAGRRCPILNSNRRFRFQTIFAAFAMLLSERSPNAGKRRFRSRRTKSFPG